MSRPVGGEEGPYGMVDSSERGEPRQFGDDESAQPSQVRLHHQAQLAAGQGAQIGFQVIGAAEREDFLLDHIAGVALAQEYDRRC